MQDPRTDRRRYAVIGAAAGVFGMHRAALHQPFVELVALADVNVPVGQQRADELGCAFYTDHQQLLREARPDVTVIMTPHPFHAQIALDCLQAGSHVLVEKPMAVQVSEADAMIEAARKHERLVGVIFQQRFRPEVQLMRRFIQEGRLGEIQHVQMTAIWTRTAHYYNSAVWRGTWKGEGGGVLMNQAPHNLDLLCHLCGLPTRVFAWTRHLLHPIETEDTVQAMLEWPNGAMGSLHISTAEADRAEHLKILGTRGRFELHQGHLTFEELDSDLRDFIPSHPDGFAAPKAREVPLELPAGGGDHKAVYQQFQRAVSGEEAFTSEGAEGRMALELANALIYSNYTHSEVVLPLDRDGYAGLLDRLRGRGDAGALKRAPTED